MYKQGATEGFVQKTKWSLKVPKMTVLAVKSDPVQQLKNHQFPAAKGAGGRVEALKYSGMHACIRAYICANSYVGIYATCMQAYMQACTAHVLANTPPEALFHIWMPKHEKTTQGLKKYSRIGRVS